jgi:hypothetical protein
VRKNKLIRREAAYATAEVVANKKVEVLNTEILALKNDLAGVTAAADSYAGENAGLRKSATDKDELLDRALAQVAEQKTALAAARAEIETWRRASAGRRSNAKKAKSKTRRKQSKPGSDPSSTPQSGGAPSIAA